MLPTAFTVIQVNKAPSTKKRRSPEGSGAFGCPKANLLLCFVYRVFSGFFSLLLAVLSKALAD